MLVQQIKLKERLRHKNFFILLINFKKSTRIQGDTTLEKTKKTIYHG